MIDHTAFLRSDLSPELLLAGFISVAADSTACLDISTLGIHMHAEFHVQSPAKC